MMKRIVKFKEYPKNHVLLKQDKERCQKEYAC
jgi:hypothetical protein